MNANKRIFLSEPHLSGNEQKYIQEALDSNWITSSGPQVVAFEKEIASYVDAPYCVALSSGTAGIHLGLKALGVKAGDYVLCSSLTFAASAFPILYEKAVPVFVDSDESTWNMCPIALERAIADLKSKGKTVRAAVVVDIYGQSAQIDLIQDICEREGIQLLEDAAEALGADYKGKKVGHGSRLAVFSFNGNKIMTTSGGGAIVTTDEALAKKIKFWSMQSREPVSHYEHDEIGYNYRMSNILAAIGRAQLETLDDRVSQRRAVRLRYAKAFKDIEGIELMPEFSTGKSNAWLSIARLDREKSGLQPAALIESLDKINAEARHSWNPMHRQNIFKDSFYYSAREGRSVSDKIFEECLCLPSSSSLQKEDQDRVISVISWEASKRRRRNAKQQATAYEQVQEVRA